MHCLARFREQHLRRLDLQSNKLSRIGCHRLRALAGQRETVAHGLDAEVGVGAGDQLQRGAGLVDGLLQGAEDVGVVELDGTHPGQAAEPHFLVWSAEPEEKHPALGAALIDDQIEAATVSMATGLLDCRNGARTQSIELSRHSVHPYIYPTARHGL